MSSPPQLRLSLPPNTFKRSFESFFTPPVGTPDATRDSVGGSGSPGATSGQSSTSTLSPDGDDNRRKRARSANSLSDPEDRLSEASASTMSSFDSSSSTNHHSARRHLLLDLGLGRGLGSSVALGLNMPSADFERAVSEPPPRIPTPELLDTEDVDMPDIDMDLSPREEHEEQEHMSHAELIRRSVDRFHAFDRHINVLRSASPPVIPLPASLSSRQPSLSPPTLPPLPLVDLGLDAEEEEEDPEHIPSTVATTTTNTPPRLDLNLPSTSSLSSAPNSPTAPLPVPDDHTSAAQFRERLDSAIDGLGRGDLQIPRTYSTSPEQPLDAPVEASSSSLFVHRPRPLAETSLFDWREWLDHGPTRSSMRSPETSSSTSRRLPARPTQNVTTTDTTRADITSSPPIRLHPRPASLAAPSLSATSALDIERLDVDLGALLDFQNVNRGWQSALDRARSLRREREREARERDDRERERQRVREEEAEREEEQSWTMDGLWGRPSRRPGAPGSFSERRAREPVHEGRDVDELMRTRTIPRIPRAQDRESQREDPGFFLGSRSARHLEFGLVDPREASRPSAESSSRYTDAVAPLRERRLRPFVDTSTSAVSWVPRRAPRPSDEDDSARRVRPRSNSRSREDSTIDWLAHLVPPTDDDWFSDNLAPLNSATPTVGASSSNTYQREGQTSRRSGAENSSRAGLSQTAGVWQPRVSPQSTAQPTRTATHARAQSIPSSSFTSMQGQPSIHRLRSRLYGPPRPAGVGSANSLVAENAAAIRRRDARAEILERLDALNASMDVDALSEPESEWDARTMRRMRIRHLHDPLLSDDEDYALYTRRAREPPAVHPARRVQRYPIRPRDSSPAGLNSTLPGPSSIRPHSSTWHEDAEEPRSATSPGLNTRRPLPTRRSIPRLRQHPIINREISPPPPASASVDRRHASWSARSRDADVSSTYQYLSALSHGFDSRSLSISDLAHTITNNSNSEAVRTPPSPPWGGRESPFSSLFGSGSSSRRNRPDSRRRESLDDSMGTEASNIPSLPPPDLGGNFERPEDSLTSANVNGPRASSAVDSITPASPNTQPRPTAMSNPFGLTMQRMAEYRRFAERAMPPSIPPLSFGGGFESTPSPLTPPDERSDSRRHWSDLHQRPSTPMGPSNEFSFNSRLDDSERRLYNYRGPSHSQSSDADIRRFFPSRVAATSHVHRDPEEPRPHPYSATDVHNALARQARLPGSRIALDRPSSPDDMNTLDLRHDGSSSFRAQRLIDEFHEAITPSDDFSPSASTWAALSSTRGRPDAESRRRRHMGGRNSMLETETLHFRHRAREPAMQFTIGNRLRRRALGDYMRDEDFDASYETLLTLGGVIGDVKPKATPDHVVAGLDSAAYKEWATEESDKRCPICLDDYQLSDLVTKLGACRHWLHKECLEQWLKGASTCPVCRNPVCRKDGKGKRPQHHHGPGNGRRDGEGPSGSGASGASGGPPNFLSFWGRE